MFEMFQGFGRRAARLCVAWFITKVAGAKHSVSFVPKNFNRFFVNYPFLSSNNCCL
jgi:hypothetical protein